MSRMGVVGTLVIGVCSGFVAANVILQHFLPASARDRHDDIRVKQVQLAALVDELPGIRDSIARLQHSSARAQPAGLVGGLFNRLSSTFGSSNLEGSWAARANGLICLAMVLDLAEKEQSMERLQREIDSFMIIQQRSKESSGRLEVWLNKAFAWYLVARVALVGSCPAIPANARCSRYTGRSLARTTRRTRSRRRCGSSSGSLGSSLMPPSGRSSFPS